MVRSRRVVLAMAAAMLAGCLDGDTTNGPGGTISETPDAPSTEALVSVPVPQSGWLEFHPVWHVGGSVNWSGQTINLSDNVSWASDGATYYYARAAANTTGDTVACSEQGLRGSDVFHAWVLVAPDNCFWAGYPTSACSAVCSEAFGAMVSAGHTLMSPDPAPT